MLRLIRSIRELIRQSKESLGQQRPNLDLIRNQMRQAVVQALDQLQAAKAQIAQSQGPCLHARGGPRRPEHTSRAERRSSDERFIADTSEKATQMVHVLVERHGRKSIITRILWVTATVIGLALLGARASGSTALTGSENRPEASLWSGVGKLTAATMVCTAIAISPEKVVTAAHCLFSRLTKRLLQPSSLHFLLGERGDYQVRAVVRSYRLGPGYNPDVPQALSEDWAVLQLQEPLPPEYRTVPLASERPDPGTPVETAGYGRDRAFVVTIDRDCQVLHVLGELLIHNCRSVPGYSGAPLISVERTGSKVLVGVNIAHGSYNNEQVALAVAADQIKRELNTARAKDEPYGSRRVARGRNAEL